MGQWQSAPPPPAGTLIVAVDGDGCCGRNIDSLLLMARPHFVQMSDGQWQQLISNMSLLVKSYWNDGRAFFFAFVGLITAAVFLSVFIGLSLWVSALIFLGIASMMGLIFKMRSDNMAIDRQIDAVLAQGQSICGGSATFTFYRYHTGVCKDKDAHEYRALWISPGAQQSMAMQVTVPEGMSGGQLVQIQTVNGMMQATIPPGLQGGAIFQVQIPNMPSGAPNASEVTVGIPTAIVAGAGDRDHNMQTAASPGQAPRFCANCGASIIAGTHTCSRCGLP
jgi:hypothetical protein